MEYESRDLKSVSYIGGYKLLIVFDNDGSKVIDLRNDILRLNETRFDRLIDRDYFKTAYIHEETGSLAWDNGYDVCPDLLYQIGKPVAKGKGNPSPLPYNRSTHKPDCQCFICRNKRGERIPKRKRIDITLDGDDIEKLKVIATGSGRSMSSLIENAVREKYLS